MICMECVECGYVVDSFEEKEQVEQGEETIKCPSCDGIIFRDKDMKKCN